MADGQARKFTQREVVPYALSDFKYRIVGRERLEGGMRPPSISFRVRRNGIAIVGYTNVQGDDQDGQIVAELDLTSAMAIPQLLERALRMQPGTHEGIAIAAAQFDRDARKWKEPRLQATFRVGRDDNGVIYLSLASWKSTRPVIKLALVPGELIKHLDGSDQPLPDSVASERTAQLWARSISEMFPLGYTVNYVPPQPKAGGQAGGYSRGQGGGGHGGGNYGNRGGSQGQSQPAASHQDSYGSDYGDDLPM